jgi:uncharacterized BrkB/YihY/UPF0761 family membrane protein
MIKKTLLSKILVFIALGPIAIYILWILTGKLNFNYLHNAYLDDVIRLCLFSFLVFIWAWVFAPKALRRLFNTQ